MRVLHTQLLVRGGVRTPLRPLPSESFWQACLPSEAQVQKLRREGGSGAVGARRSRLPLAAEERLYESGLWGQLTTRGADEARAVGARLERWLAERPVREGPGGAAEPDPEAAEEAAEEQQNQQKRRTPWRGIGMTALATPDLRGELTARATLGGLVLPPKVRVPVDTLGGSSLRVGHLLAGALGDSTADAEARLEAAGLGTAARHDVALDLLELLGLGSSVAPVLEAASWPELLDIAECASIFGQLPRGDLAKSTRGRLFRAPRLAAQTLLNAADESGEAPLAPLLQTLLSPSLQAARGLTQERLRVTVLPGFSMLCWAHAMGLDRAMVWPAPSTCFIVETMCDDTSRDVFLRVWHLRDLWEIRPSWHNGQGPVRLDTLLEELSPFMGSLSEPHAGEP